MEEIRRTYKLTPPRSLVPREPDNAASPGATGVLCSGVRMALNADTEANFEANYKSPAIKLNWSRPAPNLVDERGLPGPTGLVLKRPPGFQTVKATSGKCDNGHMGPHLTLPAQLLLALEDGAREARHSGGEQKQDDDTTEVSLERGVADASPDAAQRPRVFAALPLNAAASQSFRFCFIRSNNGQARGVKDINAKEFSDDDEVVNAGARCHGATRRMQEDDEDDEANETDDDVDDADLQKDDDDDSDFIPEARSHGHKAGMQPEDDDEETRHQLRGHIGDLSLTNEAPDQDQHLSLRRSTRLKSSSSGKNASLEGSSAKSVQVSQGKRVTSKGCHDQSRVQAATGGTRPAVQRKMGQGQVDQTTGAASVFMERALAARKGVASTLHELVKESTSKTSLVWILGKNATEQQLATARSQGFDGQADNKKVKRGLTRLQNFLRPALASLGVQPTLSNPAVVGPSPRDTSKAAIVLNTTSGVDKEPRNPKYFACSDGQCTTVMKRISQAAVGNMADSDLLRAFWLMENDEVEVATYVRFKDTCHNVIFQQAKGGTLSVRFADGN